MEVATLEAFALNTKRVTRSRTSDQRDGDRDTEMESGTKKTYRQFFSYNGRLRSPLSFFHALLVEICSYGGFSPPNHLGFSGIRLFIHIYQKLQFYVELAFAEPRSRYTSEKYHTYDL